jgi:heparanase
MTNERKVFSKARCVVAAFVGLLAASARGQQGLNPHSMPVIGHVDPRYVSFNVEAVEVTGGRFWKPFTRTDQTVVSEPALQRPGANSAAKSDPYQYRAPIDLSNPKLQRLALALSPAYLRVSGTWRNSTYFQDNDEPALQTAPQGFNNVMTRAEWKGVVSFARSTKTEIVTSVAISDGTRDSNGVWTPSQAKTFFEYTRSVGGRIAASEFMNEPTFAAVGGAPKGYDAGAFASDVKAFRTFLHSESPETLFLGPGSIGEGPPMVDGLPLPKMISSEEIAEGHRARLRCFLLSLLHHALPKVCRQHGSVMGKGPDIRLSRP